MAKEKPAAPKKAAPKKKSTAAPRAKAKRPTAVAERKAEFGDAVTASQFRCRKPGCGCPEYQGGGYICQRSTCRHSDTWHV